jgi:serine/threonine protein phosphatase 1
MSSNPEDIAPGRLLAIGDVHGCSRALDRLLWEVAPRENDIIVFLGDYIDRGPDSRGVIDRVIALSLTHNVVPLRGNHEIMILAARTRRDFARDWLNCGGIETLESYHGQTTRDIPASHWTFLERTCRDYFETEHFIFVHATAEPDLPMDEQSVDALFWNKFQWMEPHQSGKTVICGHTSQKSGLPSNKGFAICIDTWAYGEGWLTCLDCHTGLYWQANQSGEIRDGML